MSLTGKVAIVTGGNSGIGKAVVLELAAQGASIVIDYVSHPEATEELEKQLAALGEDQVIGVDADVSKVADLQMLVDKAVEKFGRLDIMVNNAGVETRTNVLDTTEAQYDFVLERQPEERVLRHPDRREADDQAGRRRQHHQHELGARGLADARQHRLLPVQGRGPDADPDRRSGTRPARHPDRQRRTGRGGHPDQHRHHERPGGDEDPGHRDPARPDGASRRRSPPWSRSWPPTAASYINGTSIFVDGGLMHSSPGL